MKYSIRVTTEETLQNKIAYALRQQCDIASLRHNLCLPPSGAPVVLRQSGAYWLGTAAQDYCLRLGTTLEESLATLRSKGLGELVSLKP